MNKMYVKPNTKVLAVKAEQLMAAVSGKLSNADSNKVGVAGNTINSGFDEEYDQTTTTPARYNVWGSDEEEI